MKKQSLTLILFIIYNFIYGQSTFTLLISNPADERPGDIIELSDHSFILTSGFFTTSVYQTEQRFFKISSEGAITHDSIFVNPNGTGTFSTLVYINDTNIFCIGDWVNLNEKDQIWVAGIDSGFNIHWNKKYQTNYNNGLNRAAFVNSQGKIIFATSLTNNLPPQNYLYLQEFSLAGDSIRSNIDSSVYSPYIFDIMEFPVNGIYKAAVMRYATNSSGQIMTIDSALNIVGIDSIPNSVYNCNTLKKINDSSYYLTGNKYNNGSINYAIMSLNENNDCKKIFIIGKNDTVDFAGTVQSLDFIDPDKIFVGGTSNFSLYGAFGQQNSWYVLSNFDSALNLRWTKYYGGDAYYQLQSVVATQDGGAILVGTRYDYPTQSNQLDIYLVKVDENGLLNNDQNQTPSVHDAIVFPNPGSDYMIIESGSQISFAEFQMINIEGKQVMKKTLSERKMTFDTQFLSTGSYVWQILFHDRIVETGKWIKD
jgi:hypothetical protein